MGSAYHDHPTMNDSFLHHRARERYVGTATDLDQHSDSLDIVVSCDLLSCRSSTECYDAAASYRNCQLERYSSLELDWSSRTTQLLTMTGVHRTPLQRTLPSLQHW